jgi:hypothetical protein
MIPEAKDDGSAMAAGAYVMDDKIHLFLHTALIYGGRLYLSIDMFIAVDRTTRISEVEVSILACTI